VKIDGTDLEAWAQRLDCRALLPELVRRLIHGTVTLSNLRFIDFPAGEGIQKHGVDGRLDVTEGHAFVPTGASVWEMGCSKDPKKKADDDYEARRNNPGRGIVASQTTFVFVTPRRWYNHEEWATERRKEGLWADVRVLDADLLEQWLDQAPAARAWLGPTLGKPQDAEELEAWWHEWSLQTDPPTSPALVYGNREVARSDLMGWLALPPSERVVKVEAPAEAIAFLYASIRMLPPDERPVFLDRAIVVGDTEALRRVSVQRPGLIILVAASQDGLAGPARVAASKGHHILRTTVAAGPADRLGLGPVKSEVMAAALEQMNIPSEVAAEYARQSQGSLVQLRRLLGEEPEFQAELAPWVLVGGWNERNEHDEALIAKIVGRDVTHVREMLRRYSAGPNAPWVRADHAVRWASHLVAFRALAPGLLTTDLDRFEKAALDVLKLPDPRYELEPSLQFAAPLYGKVLPHSRELRQGCIDSLALLATSGQALAANLDGQRHADRIVTRLLEGCTLREH